MSMPLRLRCIDRTMGMGGGEGGRACWLGLRRGRGRGGCMSGGGMLSWGFESAGGGARGVLGSGKGGEEGVS